MSKPVLASTVRAWGLNHLDALSPEAQKSAQASRGVLHADLVKRFNAKRAKARRYVPGAGRVVTAQAKADAAARREAARAAGFEVGSRGRLPKAAVEALKG
jgi:hypothetical protein